MVNFKEINHFSRFQRGSNIFQGGPTFSRGGGSNCLFPIDVIFQGGPDPLSPPLDPHLPLGVQRETLLDLITLGKCEVPYTKSVT